jgi:3-hydroxyacyl-[acyl-carrier-protein] dehydratase
MFQEHEMAQAADTTWGSSGSLPGSAGSLPSADEKHLRDALKHCSASTYEAACRFRQTGNTEHLPAIVLGIIERHVEPGLRARLQAPDDDLRLVEDLGIDSLTMMEVVALTEDVFQVSISSRELHDLRTVGQFRQFMTAKLGGAPTAAAAKDPPEDWD